MTNNPQALRSAASAMLSAAEMLEHNDAIFKGEWKKGSKAWSGDFIERTVKDGLALLTMSAAGVAQDEQYTRIAKILTAPAAPTRRDGHSALRVRGGKIETFDPHAGSAELPARDVPPLLDWLQAWWKRDDAWREHQRKALGPDVAHLLRGVADMIEATLKTPPPEAAQTKLLARAYALLWDGDIGPDGTDLATDIFMVLKPRSHDEIVAMAEERPTPQKDQP